MFLGPLDIGVRALQSSARAETNSGRSCLLPVPRSRVNRDGVTTKLKTWRCRTTSPSARTCKHFSHWLPPADFIFGPLQQADDIGPMFDEDKNCRQVCKKACAGRSNRAPPSRVQATQHHGRGERGQRNVASRRHDDKPGQQGSQGRSRQKGKRHAGPRGHAFAAAKAEIDGKKMTQKSGQARADFQPAVLRRIRRCESCFLTREAAATGSAPLAKSRKKDENAETFCRARGRRWWRRCCRCPP